MISNSKPESFQDLKSWDGSHCRASSSLARGTNLTYKHYALFPLNLSDRADLVGPVEESFLSLLATINRDIARHKKTLSDVSMMQGLGPAWR